MCFRKRWYEYVPNRIVPPSSLELSKSHRLTISDVSRVDPDELRIKLIKRVLTIANIYHLDTMYCRTTFGILVRMMDILPALNSLKIHSIVPSESTQLSAEERDITQSVLSRNKVTSVYIEEIRFAEEIFVCATLCPFMMHLKVNYINIADIHSCLRTILTEINHECHQHLRSLCFRVPGTDDQLIESLDKMINDEKLLINYTIKHVYDDLFLRWK